MSLVPVLTSNTSGLPFVEVSATSERDANYAYKPFVSGGGNWSPSQGSISNQWLKIKFDSNIKVKSYLIGNITTSSTFFSQLPKKWELQASNDDFNTFDVLDTQDNQSWDSVEDRTFNVDNNKYYRHYRLFVISNNGNANYLIVGKLALFGDIKVIEKKILLKSNSKVYSLKSERTLHETKMTSNTNPVPYVASASSIYSTTYPAWRAFDGSTTTNAWSSANNTPSAWIQLDFGTTKKINKVNINCTQGISTTIFPKRFTVLASNDGINFDTLSEFSQVIWETTGLTKEFSFNNEKDYRYYRINILENNGGAYSSITEVSFEYISKLIFELPSENMGNFLAYGSTAIEYFNTIYSSKIYILQDTVSENESGLLVQDIDKKPLSIKFE